VALRAVVGSFAKKENQSEQEKRKEKTGREKWLVDDI
jgi:hypothetical protein